MVSLNIRATTQKYWLASRITGVYPSNTHFYVRYVAENGGIGGGNYLLKVSNGNIVAYTCLFGIRPVLHLSQATKITGGKGTKIRDKLNIKC